MKEYIKDIKEIINNLKATPKGKAVLFFGFYLIFFIIIFVIASIGSNSGGSSEYEGVKKESYKLDLIKANNYSFTNTYTIDLESITLSGERYGELSLFRLNNILYFNDYNSFYMNSNNIWVDCNNPDNYSFFTDMDNIEKIIDKSTLISKTDYESGKYVYNYEISTTTLVKMIDKIDIDLDDKSNEIIISTDEEGNVNKISYVLDSYGVYKELCKIKLSIDLEFDKFGEIKEIESPI